MRLLIFLENDEVQRGALRRVGGITVLRRLVRTAERAGYPEVAVLADGRAESVGPCLVGTCAVLQAPPDRVEGAALLLSPLFLPERRWLEDMSHADGAAAVLVAGGAPVGMRISEEGARGPWDPPALSHRLREGVEHVEARGARIADDDSARDFEKVLVASLVKDTEGFMSRHVERPISIAISRRLMDTRITPNQMTVVSAAVGLLGALCFLGPGRAAAVAGASLFLLHSILDGCDGELARLRMQESRWGGALDFWSDNVVHVAVFAALGIRWALDAGRVGPLLPAALAIAGTLVAATVVFRRARATAAASEPLYTSVGKGSGPSALVWIADALSRRDFIWLVVVLAAVGRLRWFLMMAAVGAPLYAAVVAWIGIRQRARGAGRGH